MQKTDRIIGPLPRVAAEEEEKVAQAWPDILKQMFMITINGDRLLQAQTRMGPLSQYITVVKGVDGNTLNVKEMIQAKMYKPFNRFNQLTRGELGCFLSHRAVWNHMIENNISHAVILEDDVLLHAHPMFLQQILLGLQELEFVDWNILFLSRNPKMPIPKKKFSKHIIRLTRAWGLFFYALSLRGAKYLHAHSTVIHEACDTFVSMAKIPNKFALDPPLCFVSDAKSDTVHIK